MEENRSSTLATNRTELHVTQDKLPAKKGAVDTFYLQAATRPNTRKAYQSDVQQFIAWGGILPASADMIMKYLHDQAGVLNPRTLSRRLVAIGNWHQYQGFPNPIKNPAIQKTLRGIYNVHGKPKEKARPLTLEQLEQLSHYLMQQSDLAALRNQALLQVGFFGSLRRSELVGIQVEHIMFVPEGMEILIPRSKTDPVGDGQVCAIPYGKGMLCAVKALTTWLEKASIGSGPVFRAINRHGHVAKQPLNADAVNVLLKKLTAECGLPDIKDYKGHSLRRGFVTSAIKKGVPLPALMQHGRWRDPKTMLGYYGEVQRFEEHAVNMLMQKT